MRLSEDNSMFLNKDSGVIITLYINNLLIFSKKMKTIIDIKMKLQKMYNIKNLNETDVCLEIQIH